MGLAITNCIMEAHAGELLIKSNALEGTTANVELPLAAA